MKFTDEEIEQNSKNTFLTDYGQAFDVEDARQIQTYGQRKVRDFYEQQKCEKCREDGICGIQACLEDNEIIDSTVDFGCTKWEPKK